jgi:type VI secretion system (T6SS) effector TldE1-like protein
MSTSTSAFSRAAHRKSSGKAISGNFLGGAAVACLMLGCAWTVYSNVLGASVYPTLASSDYDLPVVKPGPSIADRFGPLAIDKIQTARLEPKPEISAPATVASGPTPTFDERFASAAPQGEPPRQVQSPQQVLASRQDDAPAQTDMPRPMEAPKLAQITRRADAPKSVEASKSKDASPPSTPVQIALNAPVSPPKPVETRTAKSAAATVHDMAQRAKAAVLSIASADKPTMVEKLWGRPQPAPSHGSLLAFASADASVTGSLGSTQNIAAQGATPRYERDTAVYDISAHMVYLPDGSRLEAHSGLGSKLDDPRYVNVRMYGATPPHLYDLTPREALFHGVAALRLNPVGGEETIFGRAGLLAHTFMLGPNGDSNGCVSFRDYNAFLNAYRNQGIKRLAVVAKVD